MNPSLARQRETRRALLRKERRELRPALLVGLLLFVGLPLLWTALAALIDPHREWTPGFATLTGIVGGWLFGAVIAAQTICRDFGRARGQFLTGLPVPLSDIVRAKARAAFETLGVVLVAAAALEGALIAAAPRALFTLADWTQGFFAMAAAVLAFWTAFAAAALTRQTMPAVMLAGLALVLGLALPLLSSGIAQALDWIQFWQTGAFGQAWRTGAYLSVSDYWHRPLLRRLIEIPEGGWMWYPPALLYRGYYLMIDLALALAATLLVMALLATWAAWHRRRSRSVSSRFSFLRVGSMLALFALFLYTLALTDPGPLVGLLFVVTLATLGVSAAHRALLSERGIQLGTKAIAWSVTAVALLSFGLSMREVGANVRVADTVWHSQALSANASRGFAIGDRRLFIYSGVGEHVFDLSDDGAATPLREFPWGVDPAARDFRPFVTEDGSCNIAGGWSEYDYHVNYVAYRQELERTWKELPEKAAIEVRRRLFREFNQGRSHISIRRIALPGETPRGRIALVPPDGSELGRIEWLNDVVQEGQSLWVLLICAQLGRFLDEEAVLVLARYPLADGARPEFVHVSSAAPITLEGLSAQHGGPAWWSPWNTGVFRFQCGADQQLYVANGFGWFRIGTFDPSAVRFYHQSDDLRFGHGTSYPISHDTLAISNASGFAVIRSGEIASGASIYDTPAVPARVIGVVNASPLSWLFRSKDPSLHYAGRGKLWEVHNASAICYDVSDPTRPRRIAHVNAPRIHNAVSGPRFLILDHGTGFSVVRHPR